EQGWLRSFFDALTANARWLHVITLAEAVRKTRPLGKVYLPDGSHPEVTHGALPVSRQHDYADATTALQTAPLWDELRPFIRGGCWRNFQVKYAEASEMYAHMMHISRRLQQAQAAGGDR